MTWHKLISPFLYLFIYSDLMLHFQNHKLEHSGIDLYNSKWLKMPLRFFGFIISNPIDVGIPHKKKNPPKIIRCTFQPPKPRTNISQEQITFNLSPSPHSLHVDSSWLTCSIFYFLFIFYLFFIYFLFIFSTNTKIPPLKKAWWNTKKDSPKGWYLCPKSHPILKHFGPTVSRFFTKAKHSHSQEYFPLVLSAPSHVYIPPSHPSPSSHHHQSTQTANIYIL